MRDHADIDADERYIRAHLEELADKDGPLTPEEDEKFTEGTEAITELHREAERNEWIARQSGIPGASEGNAEQVEAATERLHRSLGKTPDPDRKTKGLTVWGQTPEPSHDDADAVLQRSIADPGDYQIRTDLFDTARRLLDATVPDHVREGVEDNMNGKGIAQTATGDPGSVELARHVVKYGSPLYREAFSAWVEGTQSGIGANLTPAQHRAIAIGAPGTGGAIVPPHLDPTVIVTNDGAGLDGIGNIARRVTLTSPGANTWNGVTSDGISVTWEGEADDIAEQTPTFVEHAIPVHKYAAYLRASIEATGDIMGLAGTLNAMIGDAVQRELASKWWDGTGTGQPTGIETALAAAGQRVETATIDVLALDDIRKLVFVDVPPRWQGRQQLSMHPAIMSAVQSAGDAGDASFTVDFSGPGPNTVLGVPISLVSAMPNAVANPDNIIVGGDHQGYVIVNKMGTTVDFVPVVFNNDTGLPTGQRGWVAYGRTGADVVVHQGLMLLGVKAV